VEVFILNPLRGRRQVRGCAAVDVVEDLADEVWIGDVCDDPALPATERAEGDIDVKDALRRYVTRRCAHVSGAVGGSVLSVASW
jgi:hypothetical protein